MSKRMKLAFSIEEILGLKAASEGREEIKPYSTEYSPTISSPGSDSYLEYSSDDEFGKRKRKRTRTTFSSAQVYELEKKFQRSQYLSAVDRLNLASALNMSDVQVKRWFQNRRCKERHRAEDLQKIQTARSPLFLYQQPYLGAADQLLLQNHLRSLVQLGTWS